jgi:hypothetical protein
VLFGISTLLHCADIVDPFHGLVFFLVPPLHILERHQCHEGVLLKLSYPCSEQVSFICKFGVSLLEFAPYEHCDLCGVLVILHQVAQMFQLFQSNSQLLFIHFSFVQGGICDYHPCGDKFECFGMLCIYQIFLHGDEDGMI